MTYSLAHFYPPKRFQTSCAQPMHPKQQCECGYTGCEAPVSSELDQLRTIQSVPAAHCCSSAWPQTSRETVCRAFTQHHETEPGQVPEGKQKLVFALFARATVEVSSRATMRYLQEVLWPEVHLQQYCIYNPMGDISRPTWHPKHAGFPCRKGRDASSQSESQHQAAGLICWPCLRLETKKPSERLEKIH